MTTQALKPVDLPAATVARALIDLIEVSTQVGCTYTFTQEQWSRVCSLAQPLDLSKLTAAPVLVQPEELDTIIGHSTENALQWIKARNINEALDATIALDRLKSPLQTNDRIHVIASDLEPFEAAWSDAMSGPIAPITPDSGKVLRQAFGPQDPSHIWFGRGHAPSKASSFEIEIEKAAKAFNDRMEQHLAELATLTPNSESTLRQVFEPKTSFELWFGKSHSPCKVLRDLAFHASISADDVDTCRVQMANKLLKARVSSNAECVGLREAAVAIAAGKVPMVAAQDVLPGQNNVRANLELELLKLNVLERYSATISDALSTKGHIAFVVRHESGQPDDFVFWPANRARNHMEVTPLQPQELAESLSAPVPGEGG